MHFTYFTNAMDHSSSIKLNANGIYSVLQNVGSLFSRFFKIIKNKKQTPQIYTVILLNHTHPNYEKKTITHY